MTTNIYDIGDLVRVTGTFTVSGTATDPTTVVCKIQDPSGNEVTYTYSLGEVTKSATGIFYKDVAIDESGVWYYRWIGTGACVAGGEGNLRVRRSEFA